MVTIEQIKQLREMTGVSVSECKKALEESGGDVERARELLRAWGNKVAEKKREREVAEGLVEAYIHSTGKIGALVDLRCETDFVAKSPEFKQLAHEIVLQIASMNPDSVPALLDQQYVKDPSRTVRDLIGDSVAKLGENIVIRNFVRFEI